MTRALISVKYHAGKGIGHWSVRINSPSNNSIQSTKELTGSFETSSLREVYLLAAITTLSTLPEGNEATAVSINSSYILDGLESKANNQINENSLPLFKDQSSITHLWNTLYYLNSRRNISWQLSNTKGGETKGEVLTKPKGITKIPSEKNTKFTAYTDGSCLGNPGKGGWGIVVETWSDGQLKQTYEMSGFDEHTTNNRMEITSAIKALESLPENSEVTIFSDSKYLIEGITKWLNRWKSNNWKLASRRPVQNKELWQKLDENSSRHRVKWQWVKGHDKNEGNNRADKLANIAAKGNQDI
ncbi:MAG: ribonuclease HI [Rhodobacteraceae bacterium]|nr:ribonuclease HI [Paracoccaceae bacterium]